MYGLAKRRIPEIEKIKCLIVGDEVRCDVEIEGQTTTKYVQFTFFGITVEQAVTKILRQLRSRDKVYKSWWGKDIAAQKRKKMIKVKL